MARPRKVERTVNWHVRLPETIAAQVDLMLYSELEGRVPYGARPEYLQRLVEADLAARRKALEGAAP